jgi:oxygen-dependent protoporphyrinogen oxidase
MTATLVIGGGLSGLVRAYALARRGHDVLLLERSPGPGGVVRTDRIDGYTIERGPNTVRPTPELWSLIGELGLASEAVIAPSSAPRSIDWGGHLHALPMSPWGLASTPLLSARAKLRLLAEPFVAARGEENETVAAFFTRRLGPEVAERLVAPFISGIFAGDARELSMAAAFPKLWALDARHGSLLREAIAPRQDRAAVMPPKGLLSFRRGLQTLPHALAASLGPRARFDAPVSALSRTEHRWRVDTPSGTHEAENVVLATPQATAAELVRRFAPAAAAALEAIPSPPVAILHLSYPDDAFRVPPRGFGFLVVPQPERRILGCLFSSCLFEDRAPKGRVLMTVFLGGTRDPQAADLTDADLVQTAGRDLEAALGTRAGPDLVAVTRFQHAIPQYDREHAVRIRAIADAEAQQPGLSFLGSYRGGISVGDVVRSALAA